jgi:D-alanyl-D-alanine carboxypeptidase/D-alanyl-D-alanine-endopeptidase (penicillin-binding protein 4)
VAIFFSGENTENISLNEKSNFTPASLTKIVTAVAALDILPLNYKWESSLQTKSKISGETLAGDLCFYGGGNPNFLTENLWVLVNHFSRNNIKKVSGDLIVDESYFDNEYFDDKRMSKRMFRAYDSPVGGASFNWNSVNLYIRPGKSVGKKAKIVADPVNDYIEVVNEVVTTSNSKNYFDIKRVQKKGVEIFIVKGRINIASEEKVFYRPVKEPSLWTGYNVKKGLEHVGVKVSGKVKKGLCKPNSKVLASVESKDLSLVIRDLMKFSNNFIAEVIAKTLVRYKKNKQGNMDDALEIISKYLKEHGSKEHEIFSVSGLSYHNKMSAESIMKLLEVADNSFDKRAEFIASLPISQIDGTLKNRFNGSYEGKVRAKTGLLNKVVGLAGYAQSKSNKRFRFVLIYNGNKKVATWKIRDAFDRIVVSYADAN